MANGDAAVAAGMDVVLGTADRRLGYDEINKTRDYIAARTNAVTPVAKGGMGATTPAGARSNLGVYGKGLDWPKAVAQVETSPAHNLGIYYSDAAARPVVRVDVTDIGLAKASEVEAAQSAASSAQGAASSAQNTAAQAKDGQLNSSVYNRSISGSYRVAYIGADGLLGWVSSSRRYKKNIFPASVDPAAVLGIDLVTFLYATDDDHEGITQWGVIAEQVAELGLDWLVDYGDGDQPEGFRYDRLALALLPVAQDLAAQLTEERAARAALEARVATIESYLS